MSATVTEFRTPTIARTTAQRVADGVVAGYLRALAAASAEPTDERPMRQAQMPGCKRGRTSRPGGYAAGNARRQPTRRRLALPA